MFTKILYGAALSWLLISLCKDRQKTKIALKKSWKSFENILPSILAIILLISLILTVLDAKTISKLIGIDSGIWGIILSAIIGCITLIPGFVAFPLAATLLQAGAGYSQIAVFLSTLMMVGFVTLPLESKYFGKKMTLKRNFLALVLAIITSLLIEVTMK